MNCSERFMLPLLIALFSSNAFAIPLSLSVELVGPNLATFDPNAFGPGPNIDRYHATISNPNGADVTALELNFSGNFVNLNNSPLTFRDNVQPPIGPNHVAETYFVIPSGTTPIVDYAIDNNATLAAAYSLEGGVALIPAINSAIVAELDVPTGIPLDLSTFQGHATVNGVQENILIPEPSAAVLCGLIALSAVVRRK